VALFCALSYQCCKKFNSVVVLHFGCSPHLGNGSDVFLHLLDTAVCLVPTSTFQCELGGFEDSVKFIFL